MSYEDDELMEEKSFKVGPNDEDELYDDLNEPLEPGVDEGLGFGKGEESEETEEKLTDKEY
jgi:hypothetical protein